MSVTLNLNTIRQRASAFSKAFEGITSEKESDQDFMRGFCKTFGINPNRIDWQYKVKEVGSFPSSSLRMRPWNLQLPVSRSGVSLSWFPSWSLGISEVRHSGRDCRNPVANYGYPLKPGHPKVSMGYEQQADEPFLAKEVRPFAQPTFQKGQEIGC